MTQPEEVNAQRTKVPALVLSYENPEPAVAHPVQRRSVREVRLGRRPRPVLHSRILFLPSAVLVHAAVVAADDFDAFFDGAGAVSVIVIAVPV